MPQGLPESDVQAVKEVVEANLRAVEHGDVEKWLQLWTEDGMSIPAGLPVVQGHAQLEKFIREDWLRRRIVTSDVRVEGRDDLAVFISTFTVPGAAPDSSDLIGHHMLMLRKQPDGRWLLAAAIYNFETMSA